MTEQYWYVCNCLVYTQGKGEGLEPRLIVSTGTNQMADDLCEHPELRPFMLSNVQLTGIRSGKGSYGTVEEVKIDGVIIDTIHYGIFFKV